MNETLAAVLIACILILMIVFGALCFRDVVERVKNRKRDNYTTTSTSNANDYDVEIIYRIKRDAHGNTDKTD